MSISVILPVSLLSFKFTSLSSLKSGITVLSPGIWVIALFAELILQSQHDTEIDLAGRRYKRHRFPLFWKYVAIKDCLRCFNVKLNWEFVLSAIAWLPIHTALFCLRTAIQRLWCQSEQRHKFTSQLLLLIF